MLLHARKLIARTISRWFVIVIVNETSIISCVEADFKIRGDADKIVKQHSN